MEDQKNKTDGLREVTQELVGWEDNKLIRTLHHLTTQPGRMITEYCSGQKNKYLSPVVYFFGVTALEASIASYSGLYEFMLQQNKERMQTMFSDPAFAGLQLKTSVLLDGMNIVYSFIMSETGQKIIFVPVLLLLTWLFYRKYNRSFKENSWFSLFTLGHITLLSLPFILFWYFTKEIGLYSGLSLVIAVIYWIWASKEFYHLTLGKAILLRIFMFAAAMLIIGSILPISLFILVLVNR